jgi:membrane associated rhomboid family serine protease
MFSHRVFTQCSFLHKSTQRFHTISRSSPRPSLLSHASKMSHPRIAARPIHAFPYGSRSTRSKAVIWSFIGLNTAVFGAWQYAAGSGPFEVVKMADRLPVMRYLQKNFLISVDHVRSGRFWTIITSEFSHQDLRHFVFNMIAFHQLSKVLIYSGVPASRIVGLILGSAVTASAAFLVDFSSRAHSSNGLVKHVGLGASGVVMGVTATVACIAPKMTVAVMGIIPMPLWLFGAGTALVDTYLLGGNTGIGHSAHLGGAAFGVAYYFFRLRRYGMR